MPKAQHGGKRAGSGLKPGAKKKNLKPDAERKSEKLRIDIRLTPERKERFLSRLNAAIESAGMSKSEFALAALIDKISRIEKQEVLDAECPY